MAIVRPQRHRPVWLPVAVLAGLIVVGAVSLSIGILWWRTNTAEPPLAPTVEQIRAELDVLSLSLYTTAVVTDGTVRAPTEYQAARDAVSRARQQWETIRLRVPEPQRNALDDAFARLHEAVERKAPSSDVQAVVSELNGRLAELGPATVR